MNVIRRSAGMGVILLASVVLILCLAGIIGIWMAKSRVDTLGDGVFDATDDSLAFIDEKLDRIEGVFKNSHRRVGLLSKSLNHLPQKDAEIQAEAKSLQKTLEAEVFEPLRSAQTWLDSTHAVAVGTSKISKAMVSSQYAVSHEDSVGIMMVEQLQEFSDDVVEILTTVQEVRQQLIDIRDDAVSARRIAVAIVARLARVETKMANLCRRIETFHAKVAGLKGEIVAARVTSRRWTMLGAVLISLLLIWFAASQIGMVVHGRSWMKRQAQ